MTEKEKIKTDMKLVNFKHFPGHDGIGIDATLVYKNVPIMHLHDGAYGGEIDYNPLSMDSDVMKRNRQMFGELLDRIAKLPEEKSKSYDISIQPNIDWLVNELADKCIQEERMKKEYRKGILYSDSPDDDSYTIIEYNLSIPALIAKYGDKARSVLKKKVDELLARNKFVINLDYLRTRQKIDV